jgi:hypothetical protein
MSDFLYGLFGNELFGRMTDGSKSYLDRKKSTLKSYFPFLFAFPLFVFVFTANFACDFVY